MQYVPLASSNGLAPPGGRRRRGGTAGAAGPRTCSTRKSGRTRSRGAAGGRGERGGTGSLHWEGEGADVLDLEPGHSSINSLASVGVHGVRGGEEVVRDDGADCAAIEAPEDVHLPGRGQGGRRGRRRILG